MFGQSLTLKDRGNYERICSNYHSGNKVKKEYPLHLTPEQKRAILREQQGISEDLADYQRDLDEIEHELGVQDED